MSLTKVLELALANGASLFAIPNPESTTVDRSDPDYWDVEPTTRPSTIAAWPSEVDNLVDIVIYDGEMNVMGQLQVLDQDDWLVDCDDGDFTRTITADV